MDWKTAFNIYTDCNYNSASGTFQRAAEILWAHLSLVSRSISSEYRSVVVSPEEMTSTFLLRLYRRRDLPFQEISGKSSYISTSLKNIAIDAYRKEKKHALPEADTGYSPPVSLDATQQDGRRFHELIAAPSQSTKPIQTFGGLEESLEKRLYDVEIHQVPTKTNKGRQTFLREAERFRSYRERKYDPKRSDYKKFDRQREQMKSHLATKKSLFLEQSPQVREQIKAIVELPAVVKLRNSLRSSIDYEKQDRLINYKISLLALDRYQKSTPVDESDPEYSAYLYCCLYDLFVHQMYRTKRNSQKSTK